MMDITSITDTEFLAANSRKHGPDTEAVLVLEIGSAIKITEHDHHLWGKKSGPCRGSNKLINAAIRHGLQISIRHTNGDLLVMRIK